MNAFAQYFLKTAVSLAVFYLFYRVFLRKETFFRFNRYYFLGSIFISLLIPMIDVAALLHVRETVPVRTISRGYISLQQAVVAPLAAHAPLPERPEPVPWLLIIYLGGVFFLSMRVLVQVFFLLLHIRRSGVREIDGLQVVANPHVKSPFSFFKWVFVHPDQLEERGLEEVLLHEREHIRQRHSLDLLLTELLILFQWPNPFVWLINRSVKETHEYLADRAVLDRGVPVERYQRTLISFILGAGNPALITPLNFSLNQKRILMMKKMRSPNSRKWRSLLLLPFIVFLSMAFSHPFAGDKIGKDAEKTVMGNVLPVREGIRVIKGRVLDDATGRPLPGVNILIRGKQTGTVSDPRGQFFLKTEENSSYYVVFRMNGFETVEKKLKAGEEQEIRMKREKEKEKEKEEVSPPAPQKGAKRIDSVLVLLDGKEIPEEDLAGITPDEIENIRILSGEEAKKKYGREGVVIVTTRKNTTQYPVSGKAVEDESGRPMPGVNVVIVNTTAGTVTGPDGRFALDLKTEKAEVAFSFIGYETVRKTLKAGDKVTVRMKKGIIRLDLQNVKAEREQVAQPSAGKAGEEIFFVVEDVPHYPGGLPALKHYISSYMKYPEKALKKGISGTVWVNFTVDEQGKVKDVYVDQRNSVDPLLDREAVRVISALPDWKPAQQRGRAVAVEMSVPVEFGLKNKPA